MLIAETSSGPKRHRDEAELNEGEGSETRPIYLYGPHHFPNPEESQISAHSASFWHRGFFRTSVGLRLAGYVLR